MGIWGVSRNQAVTAIQGIVVILVTRATLTAMVGRVVMEENGKV
jgi:hypothetical protein